MEQKVKSVGSFSQYVNGLERIVAEWPIDTKRSVAALDGEPSATLRRLVGRNELRAGGIFFTSSELAKFALINLHKTLTTTSRILDPACGAGDLLLQAANQLISHQQNHGVPVNLARSMMGIDIQPEFVQAARCRLALLGLTSKSIPGQNPEDFIHLSVGDSLNESAPFQNATHIVMNPPFVNTTAHADINWRKGRVTSAALFCDYALKHAQPGTYFTLILPDVLRSGTSYDRWRTVICRSSEVHSVRVWGRFAPWGDVDVFVLELRKTQTPSIVANRTENPFTKTKPQPTLTPLTNKFLVRVGPVVPHRSPKTGPELAYIHAGNAKSWTTVKRISEKRRFAGTTFQPPFAVARRTSGPGDKHRFILSIIKGKRRVAVENHLIVLVPRSGKLEELERLMRYARTQDATEWFNNRIRCRHLTTKAVAELPIPCHG